METFSIMKEISRLRNNGIKEKRIWVSSMLGSLRKIKPNSGWRDLENEIDRSLFKGEIRGEIAKELWYGIVLNRRCEEK